MEIIPFENLKITIITLVVELSDNVNIKEAFLMLPITKIDIGTIKDTNKCKIPHCSIPGSILSMRFKGNVRGIIKNTLDPFKNAVTLDISTIKKNISLKLSANCIQMCGASSKDDGIEAANHIIEHLNKIQILIEKIKNTDITEMVNWVKINSKGQDIMRNIVNKKQFTNISLLINKNFTDNLIKIPNDIPSNFDLEIAKFFISFIEDFVYHSDFCHKIDFISKVDSVINTKLFLKNIDEVMVNYNYSIGFKVNRTKLNNFIDGKYGFISRYNNALANSVTIELPYDNPNRAHIKRRKNKVPHHTFLVYRSGSITQSGPGGKIMRDAYYLFMNTINEFLELLKSEGEVINFKTDENNFKHKYIKKQTKICV
jgi:hypothetical protein